MCTWLAEATNIFLQDNKTEDSIEKYLDAICKFIPEPYSKTVRMITPCEIKFHAQLAFMVLMFLGDDI